MRSEPSLQNLRIHKILWIAIALLGVSASILGILFSEIYVDVVDKGIMSGILSQDIVTVFVSLIIIFFTVKMRSCDIKKQLIILGIIVHLFYGYGIYVIEQLYTVLYFMYMAIFGMSAYAIIYFLMSIKTEKLTEIHVSRGILIVSIIFALINPLLFVPLWLSQIIPLIISGDKLEFMFSIYILDLCFIMPGFLITVILAIKRNGLGLLMIPVLFVIGFTLLLSVALGAVLQPLYEQSIALGELFLYLVLSMLFFALTAIYLKKMKIE